MPVEVLDDGRKRIRAPLDDDDVRELHAGDVVLVSGMVYAARDAAHKRMMQLLDEEQPLPFDPVGAIVYYVGPTPAKPGNVIGAAGPTTASRMDAYTPRLLDRGLKGIIGKGNRGRVVRDSIRDHQAVYMAALGGGGALAALAVKAQEVIAFEEMGPEAVRRLELEDFPVWVVNDAEGRDFYQETVSPWRRDEELPEFLRGTPDHTETNGNGGG
ncbi:MAG: Fe-S-containing hydro-lyase [Actinomycetota bacterium]